MVCWREAFGSITVDILDCCRSNQSDPDHTGPRGMSQTAPDRQAIPLCRSHHDERQHKYPRTFWKMHGIDKDKLLAELNRRFEEL